MKRRVMTIVVAAMTVLMMFSGTALAHYCTNASKKEGAGNAGVLYIAVDGEEDWVVPEKTTVKLNRQGRVAGGFIDLVIDFGGDGTEDWVFHDLYAHASLPREALLAAGCDRGTETNIPFFEEYCPPAE